MAQSFDTGPNSLRGSRLTHVLQLKTLLAQALQASPIHKSCMYAAIVALHL